MMTQLSLFSPQFDSSIRRVEYNNDTFYSLIDMVSYFAGTNLPPRYWSDTKKRLEKEGFQSYDRIVQLKLVAQDGKLRETDVADMDTCFLVLMSIPVPKDETKKELLEDIKQWLASLGAKDVRSRAAALRENNIEKLTQAGYAQHPEVLRLKDRHVNIEVFQSLKHSINLLCDNPHWGAIINAEYKALLGGVASELETILQSKSIRDSLPSVQLTALTFAERSLQSALGRYEHLTNEQIIYIIEQVVKPIGDTLRAICDAQGIHYITGKPLLTNGN